MDYKKTTKKNMPATDYKSLKFKKTKCEYGIFSLLCCVATM